jgi:DNA helicase II / ATP-dependent DNA helicase PcrA
MNDLFFQDLELIKKDKKQYKAFLSKGSTVVVAGPGSGKTRVLTLKAVTLARSNIHKPCGIACISYSRESVRELKKRLALYGYIPTNRDFVGTVHGFSLLHVIQPFAHLYPQYAIKYPIKILPYEVSNQIHESILEELEIENEYDVSITEINKHRSLAISGRSLIQIPSTKLITEAARLFEEKTRRTEYIDFVDIINISARIIHEQEYVRQSLQSRFPWLLVDEYQDLGKALHEMVLELLFSAGIKLYAVGDENQSIYGFNGGYPDFLNELTRYDSEIRTIKLSANYRSTQHIIDASLEALQPTPPHPKYTAGKRKYDTADFTFVTCEEEMEEQYKIVALKVIPNLIAKGIPLNEIGVIASSNAQINEIANFLERGKISFFIVNWKFESSAVVVWLQECATWCTNRNNQSFDSLFNFWRRLVSTHNDPRKNWENICLKTDFYDIINKSSMSKNVYKWLQFILTELGLKKLLDASEMYPNEIENIDRLLLEARLHNLKNASIQRFANLGFPENEVTITTRHSSKGLEFEAVVLLGMEEEHFPSYYHLNNPVALAEDQRLCYVCISRAKKICVLLRSKVFTLQTKKGPWRKKFKPSRFWMSLHNKFGNEFNTVEAKNM